MDFDEADVYKCGKCTHLFSQNVIPLPEEIYSPDYFFKEHEKFFANPDIKLYKNICSIINQSKSKDSSIVDIGCGTGSFLEYLKSNGFRNLTGIDLIENSDNDIEYVQKNILDYTPNYKFEVVVSNMNIEHIEELDLYINKVSNILSDEGVFVINTINDGSLMYFFAKVLYKINIKFIAKRLYSPHHVNHFNLNSLEFLLKKHNYKLEARIVKNYPLSSVDVSIGLAGFAQKIIIFIVFLASSFGSYGISQTQIFKKNKR